MISSSKLTQTQERKPTSDRDDTLECQLAGQVKREKGDGGMISSVATSTKHKVYRYFMLLTPSFPTNTPKALAYLYNTYLQDGLLEVCSL